MTSLSVEKSNKIDYITIGSLLLLFVINYIWFSSFNFKALVGDDLFSHQLFSNQSSFWQFVFQDVTAGKYRPVYNVIQYVLYNEFGTNYRLFFYFNILFNFIIVGLVFFIVRLITNNKWIALLIGMIYITSRFSYYNILQLYGLMEAVCLFFLLLMTWFSIRFYRSNKVHFLYVIFVLDLLIIFTHERYIVLTPFILGLILLNQTIKPKIRYILMLIACVPVLFNIFLKMFVLNTKVLEGTGGVSISFDMLSFATLFLSGILNLFGINIGAAYLNGLPFQSADGITKLLSIGILALILVTLILYIKKIIVLSASDRMKQIKIVILASILILSLIAASSITIRQEYRWLYAPFIIFMLFLSYVWSFINIKKRYILTLLVLLAVFNFKNDLVYKKYASNIFFTVSQHIADTTYNETIKKYGENLGEYSVYIENHSSLTWTLQESVFFQIYTENKDFKAIYVQDLSEIELEGRTKKDTVLLKLNPITMDMENVTSEYLFEEAGEYSFELLTQGSWSVPGGSYPLTTLAGEKLYYRFVSKYNKNRGMELKRLDNQSLYTLSKIAISDSTIHKLEPGSFAYYTANDEYDFLWISVPSNMEWDTNLYRFK